MIAKLSQNLRDLRTTSTALVTAAFKRIAELDPKIHAFLSTQESQALEAAHEIDLKFKKGDTTHPLAGIPIGIKDNICVKGQPLTCASKILGAYRSVYDATVTERLKTAGMVPLGKLNLDEFAMGSSTENSAYGPTRNPWNTGYVPGGSSGGSAAAVAAGFCPVTLGSDTGGSIRQPAAFCGVTGIKPTYGRVSRYGLVAFASSLDQIGPIARSVSDCAYTLSAIAGHDPRDSTSSSQTVPDFTQFLGQDIRGLRIGVPQEALSDTVDPEIKSKVTDALDLLKAQGAIWELFPMPELEFAVPIYYIIAPAEASANLSRFDGVRYGFRASGVSDLRDMYRKTRGQGFGDEVKRRIILGTYVLSSGYYDAYYLKAQKARSVVYHAFASAFQRYDVILTPTTPSLPFPFSSCEDPLSMYLADILTIPANLAGLPALSMPCGFSKGLPVGLQLIGKHFDEATLFKVGHAYQQLTDYHERLAPVMGAAS